MLLELAAQEKVVAQCFAQASDILGYDLTVIIADNPNNTLHQTEYTQPALLTASIALWRLWQHRQGCEPSAVAGHSLGEYSALVAARSLDFSDAVALVAYRGKMMNAAVPIGAGKMAAILGLTEDIITDICQQVSNPNNQVWLANDNCPGQLVIAGHTQAVEKAMVLCSKAKARRVLPLAVSVPSHTPLMQTAADAIAERLATLVIKPPQCTVWKNVDAAVANDSTTIREGLIAQLISPVRWTDCIRNMSASGITSAVEMGPGKVLSGLVRRIDRTLAVVASDSDTLLQKAIEKNNRESNHV
jgi:[acyl-carrier-protein] S-malonyltransferase